jgi:hypothetical protein
MNTTTRLACFGVTLVAVLGVGAGLGAAVGPDVTHAEAEAQAPIGEGVVSTVDGYRMVPLATATSLDNHGGPFRFAIQRQNGEPVHAFTLLHERDLHLIVVNRELTTFRHVHPTLDADGTWSVDLPALDPGSYRAIADFQVADGPRLALGTDLRAHRGFD